MSRFTSKSGQQIEALQIRLSRETDQESHLYSPTTPLHSTNSDSLNYESIQNLKEKTLKPNRKDKRVKFDIPQPDLPQESKKSGLLGTFDGVFLPVTLTIWGVILFVRLGFIIGQSGIFGACLMFTIGYSITLFTTLSISAISTNGTVKGGGPYYLISRSLGPEFGGSIGLIFFIGTVITAGLNVVAFIEPLISNFGAINGTSLPFLPEDPIFCFLYGSLLIFFCTLICFVGAKFFAKASFLLSFILLISTISIYISFIFQTPFQDPSKPVYYTGLSLRTFEENFWPEWTESETYSSVFGVLFPACIGILAGASMSGDLRKPSKSIPKGTLWALVITYVLYISITVLLGSSTSRKSLRDNFSVLQDISVFPPFITIGVFATAIFSTLGAIISAAKVLQAVAKDNLLPFISYFARGSKKKNEPRRAVFLNFFLVHLCIVAGDINLLASLVTMCALLTFGITNLACFLLKIGSAPNFRPSFQYFKWWTAFIGVIISFSTMFVVNTMTALISTAIMWMIFILIHFTSPPKAWGDVTQGLIYHQVRKYLLRLDVRKEHVKFWRPQILLLVNDPRTSYFLIQFCNSLKKGGLYVLGHIITGNFHEVLPEMKSQLSKWLKFVDISKIKAFTHLTVAENFVSGARSIMMGTGLGGMKPNIVVINFFDLDGFRKIHSSNPTSTSNPCTPKSQSILDIPGSLPTDDIRDEPPIKPQEYMCIIEDVLALKKTVAIAYHFQDLSNFLPNDMDDSEKKYIDIWPILTQSTDPHEIGEQKANYQSYTMVFQLGTILHMVPYWKNNFKLRVMCFVEHIYEVEAEYKRVKSLLDSLRIPAELKVLYLNNGQLDTYQRVINGEPIDPMMSKTPSLAQLEDLMEAEPSRPKKVPKNVYPPFRSSQNRHPFSQSLPTWRLPVSRSPKTSIKINVPFPYTFYEDDLSSDSEDEYFDADLDPYSPSPFDVASENSFSPLALPVDSTPYITEPAAALAPPTSSSPPGQGSSTPPRDFNEMNSRHQHMILNELMRLHSSDTAIILTSLPAPEPFVHRDELKTWNYLEDLEALVNHLPPTLLVHATSITVTSCL